MSTSYLETCFACGEVAFNGRCAEYEYPAGSGNFKNDIQGELEDGAGQCKACGEYFCADHNELEDGLCPKCREEKFDDVPF